MIKNILKYGWVIGLTSLVASPAFCARSTRTQRVYSKLPAIFNGRIFGYVHGLWFLYVGSGSCSIKKYHNAIDQKFHFSIAAVGYYILGYNLMYPLGTWSVDGVFSGVIGVAVMEAVGISADKADDISYATTGSDYFFQLMFCAATASIVSGALAERIKLWPFLLFTLILTAFIYPLQASWKWGGGFLDEMGFLDFAGSTVVHSVGGWAALAGALILGPRIGKYKDGKVVPMPGANLPIATLGVFILWLGWFGFNGGSQLAMGTVGDIADVSRIFANTNAAAAGGAIMALILTQVVYGKVDLTMVLNGALLGWFRSLQSRSLPHWVLPRLSVP